MQVGTDAEVIWQAPMDNTATLTAGDSVKDYASFWKSVKIKFYNPTNGMSKESYINYITSNSTTNTPYLNLRLTNPSQNPSQTTNKPLTTTNNY